MNRFWIALLTLLLPTLGFADADRMLGVPKALPGAPPLPVEIREKLEMDLVGQGPDYRPRTQRLDAQGRPLFTNRLLLEKSPYLRQHAHNPVNWYPWGEEAFAEAQRLGRPIFVSIGYSTCHWCHVMEEESFDQVAAAQYLNEHFIAIKVDREARPDVDSVYMGALHAMGKQGGWPLNVWLTPDGKPFFGGTYFPPEDRGGRPGFTSMLKRIQSSWSASPERVTASADTLASLLKQELEAASVPGDASIDPGALDRATSLYLSNLDPVWGGIGSETKFPSSFPSRYLLREYRRTQNPEIRAALELTLEKMASGGLRDQLGGGFHRYSTERKWLIPHFEIMLYDNAQLALAYLEASQLMGRADFAEVSRGILDYLLREMQGPEGGFYSATDADTLTPSGEKEEGWFFTWTPEEVRAALPPSEADAALAFFEITEAGDLEGRNVLNTPRTQAEVAAELELSEDVFAKKLASARSRLMEVRARRPGPERDEKILAAWNGLAISAFARAGFVLDEPRYLEAAQRAASFVLDSMETDGRLHRVSMDGEAGGPAFLEDYGLMIGALIDLYEVDGQSRWLSAALALQQTVDEYYLDAEGGGYFRTSKDGEVLIAREKPLDDGVIPSGNSVAASNLLRLGTVVGEDLYLERLAGLRSAFHDSLESQPVRAPHLLSTLSDELMGMREIVIVTPEGSQDAEVMLAPLRDLYGTNRVVAVTEQGPSLRELSVLLPPVKNRRALAGKVTAFVCENHVCQFPTSDPAVFRKQLEATKASGMTP
ncbi:MAG: thioredoxin domain-containing protein [Myxococcota bacterium]